MSAQLLLVYFTSCSSIGAKIKENTAQRKMWGVTFSQFNSSLSSDKTLKNQNVLQWSCLSIRGKKISHWCLAVTRTGIDITQILSSIWKQPLILCFFTEKSSHFKLCSQINRGKFIVAACHIGVTTRTNLDNEVIRCSHYPCGRVIHRSTESHHCWGWKGPLRVHPVPPCAQSRVS